MRRTTHVHMSLIPAGVSLLCDCRNALNALNLEGAGKIKVAEMEFREGMNDLLGSRRVEEVKRWLGEE